MKLTSVAIIIAFSLIVLILLLAAGKGIYTLFRRTPWSKRHEEKKRYAEALEHVSQVIYGTATKDVLSLDVYSLPQRIEQALRNPVYYRHEREVMQAVIDMHLRRMWKAMDAFCRAQEVLRHQLRSPQGALTRSQVEEKQASLETMTEGIERCKKDFWTFWSDAKTVGFWVFEKGDIYLLLDPQKAPLAPNREERSAS